MQKNWYFSIDAHGHPFSADLIRKLLAGHDKYFGLIQCCKSMIYTCSSRNALCLLSKLLDVERNEHGRAFIKVFVSLDRGIYKEMHLHRHIKANVSADAMRIVTILKTHRTDLKYQEYVNCEEAWMRFIKFKELQSDSKNVGCVQNKEEIEQKEILKIWSLTDNNVSDKIFEKYKAFMYENDDGYRTMKRINKKYRSCLMNVQIKKTHHWKVKISFVVNHAAGRIFDFLRDSYLGKGADIGWDKKLISRNVEEELNANDLIMHEVYKSYKTSYRFRDCIVLRTFRVQQYQNKKYFIVHASIANYEKLPEDGTQRCVFYPSGFEIEQYKNCENKSSVTVRYHLTEESINIIKSDLLGEDTDLFDSFLRISALIKQPVKDNVYEQLFN